LFNYPPFPELGYLFICYNGGMGEPRPLVLIADDEASFQEIFSLKLRAAGLNIALASDGEETVAKARELKPDLILMDMKMPKMTGAEALIKIKEDPELKDTKILFLSSLGGPLPEIKSLNDNFAKQLGAVGYLRKSDDLDDLVREVQVQLGQR